MLNWKVIGWVFLAAVLVDVYVFAVLRSMGQGMSSRGKIIFISVYWAVSILAVLLLISQVRSVPGTQKGYLFFVVVGFFIAKLLAAVIFLVDDLRRIIQWMVTRAMQAGKAKETAGEPISRSALLSWLGIAAGGTLFGSLIYGFTNKYSYKVHRIKLAYDNLPAAFKGLRIVQLSDIHSGSLADRAAVAKGVEEVLALQPDLILFTGDLVNDIATEMEGLTEIFGRLKAPMGVFSTLGNHDYGDYIWWETPELKRANLERLKQMQADMGWQLLMNEHVALERGGQQIALIGIENWSAKARFPKHGKLKEAYAGAEKYPFKILMSHDPSHWDAEVRPHFSDIDLALAGHTHGMQFGIEIPGLKWSPVKYLYKQWAGLYEEGRQKLYVNRGFGFIGYPGRVGILPEITLIELA